MNSFNEDLNDANELIKSILVKNKELAAHPFHKRDESLMSILYSLKNTHEKEFNQWIESKGVKKIELGIGLHINFQKYSFSSDSNKIYLKHGQLNLGSYPYKNIHTLLQEFGFKEKELGYYVLILYMIEQPRLEVFNVDSILSKFNKIHCH